MTTSSTIRAHEHGPPEPQPLSVIALMASRPAALVLGFTPLGREMRRFAERLESIGQGEVNVGRERPLQIDVSTEAIRNPSQPGEALRQLNGMDRLWSFCRKLSIRDIHVEPRLDSDQILTVLKVLFACRRGLYRRDQWTSDQTAAALRSPAGLTFACTVTRLDHDTLSASYSYCRTRLSRLVGWFEKRHPKLADHRALFWAAPRYGLLMGVMVLLPFALYALSGTRVALLAATTASALIAFSLSHLFFMTIGGLVYDNEEQGHQLRKAHGQLRLYADRIQRDLKRARDVQQKLLPDLDQMPLSDRLEWAAKFLPESEVGGDYFDAASLDSDRVAIVFADVSGHGMSAALVTAIIKMAFLDWVKRQGKLDSFLEELNLRLRQSTPDSSFAAVCACVLDTRTGLLTYKNCGHNPQPSILRAVGADIERLEHGGDILLGVAEHLDETVATVMLQLGDTLLFTSDGLIEASNEAGEMFGVGRLDRVTVQHGSSGVCCLADRLTEAVDAFSGGAQIDDDRTILAVRIRHLHEDASMQALASKETQQ